MAEFVKCPLHGSKAYKRQKDGDVWYSHKKDDGTWCSSKDWPAGGGSLSSGFEAPKRKDDTRAMKKYCLELAVKTPGTMSADEALTVAEKYWMFLDRKGENQPDPWEEQ
jgi:hypothetical protein